MALLSKIILHFKHLNIHLHVHNHIQFYSSFSFYIFKTTFIILIFNFACFRNISTIFVFASFLNCYFIFIVYIFKIVTFIFTLSFSWSSSERLSLKFHSEPTYINLILWINFIFYSLVYFISFLNGSVTLTYNIFFCVFSLIPKFTTLKLFC